MNTKVMTRSWRVLMPALVLSVAATGVSAAEQASAPAATSGQTERCLTIRTIRQTKVIDDQTIIFYTTGKRNYKNRLPHTCGGLAIADSFSYRTSQSQLCSIDIITVLNRMGSDLAPGASCGLGEFEPIDKEQLDELTNKSSKSESGKK